MRLDALQRAILKLESGPARAAVSAVYRLLARFCATYVRCGDRRLSVYVRGSFASADAVPGLTDVDTVLVTSSDPTGAARRRARKRIEVLSRSLPLLGRLLDRWALVYDEPGLLEIASRSTLTFGIDHGRAVYAGGGRDDDCIRTLERPELYGPSRSWRLLAGPDRRPPEAGDPHERRIACWLELQNWWRWGFQACIEPDRLGSAYTCAKLIAESARIWLWLTGAEVVVGRAQALARGAAVLPAEADAFDRAGRLLRELGRARRAPLDEFLPPFLRLSGSIAGELERQLATAGSTEVRLLGAHGALTLPHGDLTHCPRVDERTPIRPLADWRSLATPLEPDEAFALLAGDPADPDVVREVALASRGGPYPTLSAAGLMIRPSPVGGRGRLRSIHCKLTDPVSFALVAGASSAMFTDAPGFSIQDTARRALAEHKARLATAQSERPGSELGSLISAARAALLWESVTSGDPELALTVQATFGLLFQRIPEREAILGSALDAYQTFAVHWEDPPAKLRAAFRGVVEALPGYAATLEPTGGPV